MNTTDRKKPSLYERLYHPLYATQQINGKKTRFRFFEQRDKIEPTFETNVHYGDHLAYPYSFEITGLSVIPSYQASSSDVKKFIDSGHLRLLLGSKEYLNVPLDAVTYYNHLQGPSQREPLRVSKLKISEPVFEFKKDSWLTLLHLQHFGAIINIDGPPLDIKPFTCHLYLHGYQLRGIVA